VQQETVPAGSAEAEPSAEVRLPRRGRAWVLPLLLFLVTFGVYAGTAEHRHVGTDAYASAVEAWRITGTGSPWLDALDVTTIEGVHAPIERGRWLIEAGNGHVVAHRMAGTVIAALPFYAVLGEGTTEASFSLAPGALAASFWTAVGVVLMFLALRRRVQVPLALAGAAAYAFATPTWDVSANGVWTHTVTQLGIAGAAYAFSRDRLWLAGFFLAAGMLGRPHLAVVAAVVGLGLTWSRRDLRPALRIALPTVAALVALSVWNHWMFGSWSLAGGGYGGKAAGAVEGFSGSTEADVPTSQWLNYLGFLVAPGRGLLVWTPVILLLLPALVRSWRGLPDWSRWLVVAGLVYSVVQLRIQYFSGGIGFYGYRYALELLACLVPALVLSVPRLGRPARWLLPPVLALQVAAVSIGAINESYFIEVERNWVDNSFWVALRYQPGVVGVWLLLCLALGLLVTVMLNRRGTRLDASVPPS
jgi:alpha-1,2-mannosyltransferase